MARRTLRTITVTIVETWVLVWDDDELQQTPETARQVTYVAHIQRRTTSQNSASDQIVDHEDEDLVGS